MKLVQILSWFFVVMGGLHFALSGIGVDLIGAVFGGHVALLSIIMGVSILYHGVPMLTAKLSSL